VPPWTAARFGKDRSVERLRIWLSHSRSPETGMTGKIVVKQMRAATCRVNET
jgi:hypothetical protein